MQAAAQFGGAEWALQLMEATMPKIQKLTPIIMVCYLGFFVLSLSSFADNFVFTNVPPNNPDQKVRDEKTLAELKKYVPVTTIGGMDRIVEVDLENLLLKNGIDSYCIGSVWYDLYVSPSKKEEASKIIHAEAKRGLFDPLYKYKDGKFVGLSESDLLYSDSMKDQPPLIKTLFNCKDIQSHFEGLTYVKCVYAKKKWIWVTPTRQEIAYDGSITLQPQKESESGCRVDFQIWDHGQHGIVLGGGSWAK